MATLGLTPAEKDAVDGFRRDVVEPSMTALVVIDFWAEWCGPCKALTPILEKVTADYAGKGVILAKVDVDANQFIANQFQVRSIPTVYAMFQGQLVADLSSARTETQLRTMLDQILRQIPVQGADAQAEAELEPLIEMGEQVLADGDAERAL
ncbi:MAG TPA: thioredoxin domain-containing protein, partial [Sphingomonas sp.]|nr:thioredoxin domain-containing protein [Sphingomonas sp.]